MSMAFEHGHRPETITERAREMTVRRAISDLIHADAAAFRTLESLADRIEVVSLSVPAGGISFDGDAGFHALAYASIVLHWNNDGLFKAARVKCFVSGVLENGTANIDAVDIARRPDGAVLLLP